MAIGFRIPRGIIVTAAQSPRFGDLGTALGMGAYRGLFLFQLPRAEKRLVMRIAIATNCSVFLAVFNMARHD